MNTMNALTSKEIKDIELNILLEFQKTCHQLHITFYLSGGTLLGAVRHKGFIPWDDDIDVCMSRPDYQKLLHISRRKKIFPDFLQLIGYENGLSPYPFMKLIDTRTRIDQKYLEENSSSSLWIDIFPVDGLPDNEKKIKEIYRRGDFYRKVLTLNFANPYEGKTSFKRTFKRFVIPVAKLYGIRRANQNLIKLAHKYSFKNSKKVGAVTWGLYGLGEAVPKEEFLKSTDVSFEGYTFQTMSCWDKYLTGLYGNYMELPPKEKRITHDMNVWIDTSE